MASFDRINEVERTILRKFSPDQEWSCTALPGNGVPQNRASNTKFSFHDTNTLFDWHEATLVVEAEILKTDDSASGANEASLVPGNFSLIRSFYLSSSSTLLYKAENVAPLLFIRKALETGLAYSEVLGSTEGFVLDSGDMSSAHASNPGFAKRNFTGKKRLMIPLKNWGFFKALKKTLLPAVQLTFEFKFQDDNLVLYTIDASKTHKLMIRSVELRVPEIKPKIGKELSFLEKINSATEFHYFEEMISTKAAAKLSKVEVNLSDILKRPLNIFVFTRLSAEVKNETRKYAFNTFRNGGQPQNFIAKLGGTVLFPDELGYSSSDKERMYADPVSFENKQAEPDGTGVCFSFEQWDQYYGFDMRKMTPLSDGNSRNLRVDLEFAGDAMAADYTIEVGTLYLVSAFIKRDPSGKMTIVKSS